MEQETLTNNPAPSPQIGVGVYVYHQFDSHRAGFLAAKRLSSLAQGLYSLPGGKLEFGETIFECAVRETFEETGCHLDMKTIELLPHVGQNYYPDRKQHFVTHYVRAAIVEPFLVKNPEPEKHSDWRWHPEDQPPKPFWGDIENIISGKPTNPHMQWM